MDNLQDNVSSASSETELTFTELLPLANEDCNTQNLMDIVGSSKTYKVLGETDYDSNDSTTDSEYYSMCTDVYNAIVATINCSTKEKDVASFVKCLLSIMQALAAINSCLEGNKNGEDFANNMRSLIATYGPANLLIFDTFGSIAKRMRNYSSLKLGRILVRVTAEACRYGSDRQFNP